MHPQQTKSTDHDEIYSIQTEAPQSCLFSSKWEGAYVRMFDDAPRHNEKVSSHAIFNPFRNRPGLVGAAAYGLFYSRPLHEFSIT